MDEMEAHLARDQLDGPFTRAERSLGAAPIKNNAKHMQDGKNSVLNRVHAVLEATFDAFDSLDDRQVDYSHEWKAMKALQKVLGKVEETYHVVGQKSSEPALKLRPHGKPSEQRQTYSRKAGTFEAI
ncbi:hypothetical protein LTR17_025147 [Elasticomyces elasticus]|nr:hypothetical protein LTR17_025147 [Elasticomyces elasticus]